jgi:hypothetical protein
MLNLNKTRKDLQKSIQKRHGETPADPRVVKTPRIIHGAEVIWQETPIQVETALGESSGGLLDNLPVCETDGKCLSHEAPPTNDIEDEPIPVSKLLLFIPTDDREV